MARRREDGTQDGGPDLDPAWVDRLRERLIDWYAQARRDLPWRADSDPYRILVSEMMLVQTTVAAVVPHFTRFLERFPNVEALARADEARVLMAWEGLGYYRRARQLHAAARAVVDAHGGRFPRDPEAVRALPGVGRYIAGALLSMAFDHPEPVLEANTQRVLARWLAWRGDLKTAATRARLWEAAERLVPPTGAGKFNQAFMELGALVCTPRAPRCLVCPVADDCRARLLGLQDSLPRTTPKPPPLAGAEACALVRHEGRLLVLRRGPGRLWHGFWEFPTVHTSGADPAGRAADLGGAVELAEGVRQLTGVRVRVQTAAGPAHSVRYSVTRHRMRLDAHEAEVLEAPRTPAPAPGFVEAVWLRPDALADRPFSSAGRRLTAWLRRPAAGAC